MKGFDFDEDTWYRLRDDRPGRIDGVNPALTRNFRLGIKVAEQDAKNYEVQVMTCVALNMFSRWCRYIYIELPDTPLALPLNKDSSTLQKYLENEITEIDPFGNFQFVQELDEHEYDCKLNIGNLSGPSTSNTVQINCSGWLAHYSYGYSDTKVENHSEHNPIGAIFSACLGVNLIYSIALNRDVPKFKKWYSTFDLGQSENAYDLNNPDVVSDFDFGRIHQIGCGAVGSSLLKFLSYTNWQGEVHLIDYDHIEVPNLCSSLAFKAKDAMGKVKKVESCSELLSETGFHPNPYDKEQGYDDFISEGMNVRHPPDLVLCLANEKNIWSTIQENYPPLVFHATTTSNWGTNFGSHEPINEWCIMCRFHEDLKQNHTPTCSESIVEVRDTGEEILGVLPFLSATSAAMLVAALGRLTIDKTAAEANSINLSFRKTPLTYIVKSHKRPLVNCPGCSNQVLGIYPDERKQSKFWTKLR